MANIEDDLKKDEAETVYYLFRPDTLVKTYGDLTFVFNPVLKGWTNTSDIDTYLKTGTEFKIIDEKTTNDLIETITDNIILKKEITSSDVEDLIFGKKKIKSSAEDQERQDIAPEVFDDNCNVGGIRITNKKEMMNRNIFGTFLGVALVIIICLLIVNISSKSNKDEKATTCEPFLKTITYHVGDTLESDFAYYSSCGGNDFRTMSFKNVDINKAGMYLYTGIDNNGTEKTGTIIVKEKD